MKLDLKELILKIIDTPLVESTPLAFATQFSNPTGYCLHIENYLIYHYSFPCNMSTSGKIFDLPNGLSADGGINFIANAQTGGQAGAYYSIANNGTSANGLSAMPFYANTWYDLTGIIKVK